MSGPFSGPPSLSQERIHGVTANLSRMYPHHGNLQRLLVFHITIKSSSYREKLSMLNCLKPSIF